MEKEDLNHFILPPARVSFVTSCKLCNLCVPHFPCPEKRVKVPSSDGCCKLLYVRRLGQWHTGDTISSCYYCVVIVMLWEFEL